MKRLIVWTGKKKKGRYRRIQSYLFIVLFMVMISLSNSIDGNSAAILQDSSKNPNVSNIMEPDSNEVGLNKPDLNKSDLNVSESNKRDSNEEDSNEEDSNEEDSNEEDSNEEDSNKPDLNKSDSNEPDSGEVYPEEIEPAEPEEIISVYASVDMRQGKKNAYISWERVKGAVSYEVQRSKKENKGFRQIVSLSGNRRKYTDTKVNRGRCYYYRVAAVMEDGDKIYSELLFFECPLGQVSGVKLIRYSTSSIKVLWNQNKDAKYYKVYCSKTKSGEYQRVGTTQKNWYRVKNLENNQFYYFRVKACAEKKASKLDSEMSEVSEMRTMTYNRMTVFAGDSITTGLSGYGILDEIQIGGNKDVIAAIGLNTITFRSKRLFSGQSGMERVILYKPYRVYIMLGINEINYRSWEDVIKGNQEIVQGIQAGSPGTDIVLLATPPVTASRLRKESGFSQIPTFNKKLEELAESMGVRYYDYTGFMKDSNGCLKSEYAAGDGYHWKIAAYHAYAKLIEEYDKSLD